MVTLARTLHPQLLTAATAGTRVMAARAEPAVKAAWPVSREEPAPRVTRAMVVQAVMVALQDWRPQVETVQTVPRIITTRATVETVETAEARVVAVLEVLQVEPEQMPVPLELQALSMGMRVTVPPAESVARDSRRSLLARTAATVALVATAVMPEQLAREATRVSAAKAATALPVLRALPDTA